MALGFLAIPYTSTVLGYDDEATPIELTGIKMLPIWKDTEGKTLNESLEIIAHLDRDHALRLNEKEIKEVDSVLDALGSPIHNLVMPYWIYTKEFSVPARDYFKQKKEVKRGPFEQLAASRSQFEDKLQPLLNEIESKLKPFWQGSTFSLKDILLASHLWGLYILPEFQFTPPMHQYLQRIKSITKFNYHQDFWK
jgi:glutaredoxin 2